MCSIQRSVQRFSATPSVRPRSKPRQRGFRVEYPTPPRLTRANLRAWPVKGRHGYQWAATLPQRPDDTARRLRAPAFPIAVERRMHCNTARWRAPDQPRPDRGEQLRPKLDPLEPWADLAAATVQHRATRGTRRMVRVRSGAEQCATEHDKHEFWLSRARSHPHAPACTQVLLGQGEIRQAAQVHVVPWCSVGVPCRTHARTHAAATWRMPARFDGRATEEPASDAQMHPPGGRGSRALKCSRRAGWVS
jgi:hypothetical protein